MFLKKRVGKSLLFSHASPTCIGFKARVRGHFTIGHLNPDVGVEMKLKMIVKHGHCYEEL